MKCSVNGKVKCIYQSKVISSDTPKRKGQLFKVIASNTLNKDFVRHLNNDDIRPTVKFDGTCCLIDYFNGRPWLWARHDIKPNKAADKRFKAYQHLKNEHLLSNENDGNYPDFTWNIESDFKELPDNWKAASGAALDEISPDEIGHIVGWVPIDPSLRNHLWHLSVVDFNIGCVLILKQSENDCILNVKVEQLEDYIGKTFELIGTSINANPYKVGSKHQPFHVLVQHGAVAVCCLPVFKNDIGHNVWKDWFSKNVNGFIEGIVWHTDRGKMFKLHRHHLELQWPVEEVYHSALPVSFDMNKYDTSGHNKNELFTSLMQYDGRTLEKFSDIFRKIVEEPKS